MHRGKGRAQPRRASTSSTLHGDPLEVKIPHLGEATAEVQISKWQVKPGDVVKVQQPLVEVTTGLFVFTIPSPRAGTVLKTHCIVGEWVRLCLPVVDLELTG